MKQQIAATTNVKKKRHEPKEMKTITIIAVWLSGDGDGGGGDGLKGGGGGMRVRMEPFSAAILGVKKRISLSWLLKRAVGKGL